MKIGDKVRFLSEVGGGIVKGFQGKDIVLVEDADGFDIPMQVRECVVIETDDYNINRKPAAAPKKTFRTSPPRISGRRCRTGISGLTGLAGSSAFLGAAAGCLFML